VPFHAPVPMILIVWRGDLPMLLPHSAVNPAENPTKTTQKKENVSATELHLRTIYLFPSIDIQQI
jgi:hypothetical protein